MNVKQLLEMCSKEELTEKYLSMINIDRDEHIHEVKEFCSFLYKLMKMEPEINNNMVLLFADYIDENVRYIDVTLYNISEIQKSFKFCKEYDRCENIKSLSDNDIEKLQKYKYTLSGYAFELAKWEEVLGYNVDEENVSEYGIENAAAAILYEITYFVGYDQRKISDEISLIDAADKKLDEFKKRDNYEEVHCMTMSDITAQLEITDLRTEADIEDDNRKTNYEHICNCINAYKVIKKYYIKKFCKSEPSKSIISV